MPDGSRKRRHSQDKHRRSWYAKHRSVRFQRRFGLLLSSSLQQRELFASVSTGASCLA